MLVIFVIMVYYIHNAPRTETENMSDHTYIEYFRYRTPSPVTDIPELILPQSYMIFMLEGEIEYIVNDAPVTVSAGEALYLPRGTKRERRHQDVSAKYYSLLFYGGDARDTDYIPTVFSHERAPDILRCLSDIEKSYLSLYYSADDNSSHTRRCTILLELLLNLCADTSRRPTQNQYVDRITEYIRDNYKQKLTLEDIAAFVHLNPSYCATLFREETGETIGSFIKNYRLVLAKDELSRGNSVKAAAEAVGFTDPYNFSRWFSKNTGISPSDYRAKHNIKKHKCCKCKEQH